MKNLNVEDIKKILAVESILTDLYDDKSLSSRKIIAESEIENLFTVGTYDSKKRISIEKRLIMLLKKINASDRETLKVNKFFLKTCLSKIGMGYCLSVDIIQYLNYLNDIVDTNGTK
ncbi:MAG: hypothetical protein H8E98_03025 [Bacteroidetes bacterium]|nr:hypothetical protein [Bacteroidota bacterium]